MTTTARPAPPLPDQRRRPVQPRGARGPAPDARRAARGRPGRPPEPVRRPRLRPLRRGPRRAGRLAGLPVGRGRGAVELPLREAVAAAEPRCSRPTRRSTTRPAGCCRRCSARGRCAGCASGWAADAEALVDEVLAPRHRASTPSRRLAAGVPAAGLPRRRRHPAARAGRTCCPTATTRSTPSGRPTTWSPRAPRGSRSCPAWVNAQCRRDVLARRRVRRGHLGGVRPRRHHARAGAARRPLAAHGRRRHDGARHLRRPLRLRHQPRASGSGCAQDPSLARVAFDEAVRWESPVQTFFRTATTDVRVGDDVVPEGHKILMFLAAANRDPRRWDDPDAFDLSRDPSGHVGFGMGIHQCVGQHVARLEAEALLTALARRVAHDRAGRADGAAPQQHAARLESIPGAGHARLTARLRRRYRAAPRGSVRPP